MAIKFKNDFLFGTATSSYQVEGAVNGDGRTPSIWDIFSKTPGKTYKGDTGDIACNHYNRYKEDVELMEKIGIESYRFSISWSRIFPEKGMFNPKGMEFYKNLVNELIKRNIKPAVTLYHWDLPLWAYNMGGWLNRDSAKWFVEYAVKIFNELGDSVRLWITHNEPLCSSIISYYEGKNAPGHKDLQEALTAAHHIFKGSYPEDMKKIYKELKADFNFIKEDDLEEISVKNDFLGLNYYSRDLVKYSPDSELKYKKVFGKFAKTEMDWEIVPEALYNLILKLRKEYTKIPIYITENGAAFNDKLSKRVEIRDVKRIDYLRRHLLEVAELNKNGKDIRGYFLWSLMDNFEWAYGYSKRFGIIYVDYETQERIFKNSAFWYRDLIKARAIR